MFIDTIEEHYPVRWFKYAELEQSGFEVLFDLSETLRLEIHISVFKHNTHQLIVYEQVQETGEGFTPISQEHFLIDGDTSSILPTLKQYLQTVIGDFDQHTYEGSFAGWLLEQVLTQQ